MSILHADADSFFASVEQRDDLQRGWMAAAELVQDVVEGQAGVDDVLDELERRNLKRGLVTMCAAGGMAPAIIIERV